MKSSAADWGVQRTQLGTIQDSKVDHAKMGGVTKHGALMLGDVEARNWPIVSPMLMARRP